MFHWLETNGYSSKDKPAKKNSAMKMVGNLFFFIRSLLGVVFLCGESFRFFYRSRGGRSRPGGGWTLLRAGSVSWFAAPEALPAAPAEPVRKPCPAKSSDPFCHAKRFTLRVVLFFTGCKVQTCCCYHDYAAADGEDRGSDSTGGREGS